MCDCHSNKYFPPQMKNCLGEFHGERHKEHCSAVKSVWGDFGVLRSFVIFTFISLLCIPLSNSVDYNVVSNYYVENLPREDSAPEIFVCPQYNDTRESHSNFIDIPQDWMRHLERTSFRLQGGFPGCSSASFVQVISPPPTPAPNTTNDPGYEYYDVDERTRYMELNGFLRLEEDYYRPEEYCVLEQGSSMIKLKVCQPTCSPSAPCMSKCCSFGKVLENGRKCVEIGHHQRDWKPPMIREDIKGGNGEFQPHITRNKLACEYPNGTRHFDFQFWPSVDFHHEGFYYPKESIKLSRHGQLMYLGKQRSWEVLGQSNFCVDDLVLTDHNQTEEGHFIIFLCSVQEPQAQKRNAVFYASAMFISAVFLLLTAVIYGLLWDKHNIHGWTILTYAVSMFFLYVLLGGSNALSLVLEKSAESDTDQKNYAPPSCYVIAIFGHFFFISTFAWLTLINYDLWSTFRSNKPVGERSRGVLRFLCYNLFSWGLSTCAVSTGVVLDHLYPDKESEIVVPQYGQVNCFIAPWAMGYYVYSIIVFLIAVNIVFIVLTSSIIYHFRKTTQMINENRSTGAQQSFGLFFKLFVIMGVTWTFEIISGLVSQNTTVIWTLLDILNICQAIGIFVIFICKRKTLDQLQQKFPCLRQTPRMCGRREGKKSRKHGRSSSSKETSSTKETSAPTAQTTKV